MECISPLKAHEQLCTGREGVLNTLMCITHFKAGFCAYFHAVSSQISANREKLCGPQFQRVYFYLLGLDTNSGLDLDTYTYSNKVEKDLHKCLGMVLR